MTGRVPYAPAPPPRGAPAPRAAVHSPREPTEWERLADHTGRAYLRYAHTRGTAQEVAFLVDELALSPGQRVLDAGCGPGRHAHALASRGLEVVGIDLAARFVELAAEGESAARFVRADVRRPPLRPRSFDAVVCVGQGGFGLLGGGRAETDALRSLAALLRPGAPLVVTAFSAYYAVRWLEEGQTFDPTTGVHRETASVRSEDGTGEAGFDLTSTCFTPRELRWAAEGAGLRVEGLWSVEPGRWARRPPELDMPELLVVARVPAAGRPGDSL
ncbi:MAG TPA: methyltransferase domain-containing protein [Acidimicrobiales bacterium]|nr:methyltransferase domain-containing protein [Acidimicrobiales bacterium]